MDEVDAVPRSRRQRPKDSFQNELQAKIKQRKSLGFSADVTDSDDDGLGSLHNADYRTQRATRPGSAKYRSDKSPDLSRGLGTTTMRARDLTQLLTHNGGHSDDDDDEEVMAATLGKSKTGSWQPHSYKTPSPKQDYKSMRRTPTGGSPKESSQLDSIYGRKTPSRESPKEQSRLDSIFGRKTPTAESPKEQSRLDSLYGRKTPTKESAKDQGKLESLYGRKTPTRESPKESGKYDLYDRKTPTKERASPGLSKEDIIFGRKTPTSDSRRMDGSSDKPWQPPSYRSVSPSSSPDHSRGSRGVTPTESMLDPINETPREKMTPRLQRGERLKGDDSPNRQVSFGERPKPQARSRIGDRKTSPTMEPSSRQDGSSMKRTTPTMDLFGKTRTSAAQEIEDMMDQDRKGRLGRDGRKTPDSTRASLKDKKDVGNRPGSRSPSLGRNSRLADGKKTPTSTGQRADLGRKSPYDKYSKEDESKRKQSTNQNSSLLDFLTGGNDTHAKAQEEKRQKDRKLRSTDDDLDNLFSANRKPAPRTALSNGRMSPDQYNKKPSLRGRSSPDDRRKFNDLGEMEENRDQERRRQDVKEDRKKLKDTKNDDTSSVCEEIALDPAAKLAKAEEKAKKSGKQTSERARADNVIDTIAGAQTMMYIEPAKKVRPVTAEAKVQHRPKPRYGALPGSGTQTLNERQFNSTTDIRDAIYEDWYADRIKQAKRKKKEDEQKKKEEEEKKKKGLEEKLHEAQLSYKAWSEQKKETLHKEQIKKKRTEEAKKEKEIEDREQKREDSKKLFEHWKNEKDARTRHELRKKREKEEEEQREKQEEEYKKRKDKESAYRGWQRRKEDELKAQKRNLRDEKKMVKTKQEDEYEEQMRKEEDNLRKYNDWLDEKERRKRREKKHMIRTCNDEEERPAWSPASRTIPFGR